MSDDILTRLRDWRSVHLARLHEVMEEAADEIARLRDALDEQTGRAAWNYDCLTQCEEKVISRDAEIERLRLAVRRLAEQDATLSVQGGNVIVEMTPGRVQLPALDPNAPPGWNAAIGAVREALADAGVEWDTV